MDLGEQACDDCGFDDCRCDACDECGGSGNVATDPATDVGYYLPYADNRRPCSRCGGSGRADDVVPT
jgi:DnaJ-class molecular chaperone